MDFKYIQLIFCFFLSWCTASCVALDPSRHTEKKRPDYLSGRQDFQAIDKIKQMVVPVNSDHISLSFIDKPANINFTFDFRENVNILYLKLAAPEKLNIEKYLIKDREWEVVNDKRLSVLLHLPYVYLVDGKATFFFEGMVLFPLLQKTARFRKAVTIQWQPHLPVNADRTQYEFVRLSRKAKIESAKKIYKSIEREAAVTNINRMSSGYAARLRSLL